MNIEPIYEPKEDFVKDPMRIVALFSGGASAVPFMVDGETYEVVGAISSDKNASGIEKLENLGISVEVNDIHNFYKSGSVPFYGLEPAPIEDMKIRKHYDTRNLLIIKDKDWRPDAITCSGYMYFLTDVFLEAYSNRILNVHPADLSILDENGDRKYIGDNAVRDAMKNREEATKSTIHIMNEIVDGGPILYMSDELPVEGRNYKEQQELMKDKCDGPAYKKALELLSMGRFFIDGESNVFIKTYGDKDGRYFGHDL